MKLFLGADNSGNANPTGDGEGVAIDEVEVESLVLLGFQPIFCSFQYTIIILYFLKSFVIQCRSSPPKISKFLESEE